MTVVWIDTVNHFDECPPHPTHYGGGTLAPFGGRSTSNTGRISTTRSGRQASMFFGGRGYLSEFDVLGAPLNHRRRYHEHFTSGLDGRVVRGNEQAMQRAHPERHEMSPFSYTALATTNHFPAESTNSRTKEARKGGLLKQLCRRCVHDFPVAV
jgi:hypothetical protein